MMTPAAPGVTPTLLIVLVLAGAIIALGFVVVVSRHRNLVIRHEALTQDVGTLKATMSTISARLTDISKDGKYNTELLYTIIRGTFESANGKQS
ncbi:hypothetical protein ACOZ4Y_12250 [Komagataeibacter rhaeticus]|nr:hypothetical protein [Komagataeibacter rhaeticus]